MRIDGQTKPAPHHFIEALFRKVTFPKLEGYLKINNISMIGNRYRVEISWFIFNKSKLQNEYDIYYRLFIDNGKFEHYEYHGTLYKHYTNGGHELNVTNAKPTLYYNDPLKESDVIEFFYENLLDDKFEVDILLHFGGKQSPLMVSKYKISLDRIVLEHPNSIIKYYEENLYSYEHSDRLGKTDEEKIKLILER